MIEYLKHIFGICGEPHGLLYVILSVGGLTSLYTYIKIRMKRNA